ncbi:MAG: CoA transferase [Paracoccaceae bacterium]|nr:CoA transferase [Paracoccaceae bacterium]
MGALDGIKVIDLTRVLGGPFGTQWLGDHGADVIKIEPPHGDDVRAWGPPFDEEAGAASYFLGVNRNKRGAALDLRMDEGREVLLRLLETADVLIENFKPGGMEKWGLGYEEVLKVRFPRLIHCRISGFGADGPHGGLPGYDAVVQAQAGMMSVNGPEGGPATRLGIPIVDIGTGMAAAFGIAMALYERSHSGRGQFIDMTLYDTAVSLLFPHAANYFLSGKHPTITGNTHSNLSPYDVFPTKTCKVFIAGGNDTQFRKICETIGREDLIDDPRFRKNKDRLVNKHALRAEFGPSMAEWDGEDLAAALMRTGAPAGPVLETHEVVAHPHTRHREMTVDIDGFRTLGNPIKMSRTPPKAARLRPPRFGQDTRAVLAEAGYSETEIENLIASGAALDKLQA